MSETPDQAAGPVTAEEHSRALNRQANALRAEGRWQEALSIALEAHDADPSNAVAAHNLGVLLTRMGRLAEGEQVERKALSLAPEAPLVQHALAHNLLAQGRYEEASGYYRAREHLPELNTGLPRDLPYPRWEGEPLHGKRLLIFPEQGMGDQIQFARFLPRLIADAEKVTILTSGQLERLFRHNFPDAEILRAEGKVEFPDPDYWTTGHEILGALRVRPDGLPAAPYLRPVSGWPSLGDGFKIGLKTQGNPGHVNDLRRSLGEEDAARLVARLPGRVIDLDPKASGARDMADTAAIIDQLDLVVSVDTSVAHLAGAMGKPCFLLLPGFSVDWRWMLDPETSPWYPGHRLYRASFDGGWQEALDAVVADAERRAAEAASGDGARERSRALIVQAGALREEGRWQEALPLFFKALQADRTNPAAAHNLGVLLSKSGRLKDGEAALRHALALAPDTPLIRHALAHNLLGQGRYEEGWPLYAAREGMAELGTGFPTEFPFPRWQGESLAGKRIAIFPEQGLGDQIQFARFLPRLIDEAAVVTLLTFPPLERLFRDNFPGAEIVLAEGNVEFPDPDYWTTQYGLAGPMRVDLQTLPAAPYIRSSGAWPSLGEGFKIGLKVKGNPRHSNDRVRTPPPEIAAQLRDRLPGIVVSLEPEDSGAKDMADTAAIIDQLDLVVSVDTSVAHLAGAMGKACALLIPGFSPDWRWMLERDDSPWYPQHKLYRGAVDGDWQDAVDRLVADAEHAAAASTAAAPAPQGKESVGLAGLMLHAQALVNADRHAEALELMQQAVKAVPDNPAPLNFLGMILVEMGRLQEGEVYQRRSVEIAPDYPAFRNTLGLNLLAQGRYREGWPLHEARADMTILDIGFPNGVACPRWRGEPLADKHVIILPEQGYGDTIQFSRFVPRLLEKGAKVTLFVYPALVDLLATSLPGVDVRTAEGAVQLGNPDYWTTLVDLMAPLDITHDDVSSAPYLRTDRTWPPFGEGFTVGLVTSGNPNHANDRRRSLPQDVAARLRDGLPGRIVSLDPKDSGARDFADTAALVGQLDLVVSVDTSVVHLAGALGKPCLLLVPGIATDWRWMRGRDDTDWYPNHRLYRGDADGRWDVAIARVCADATAIAHGKAPGVHRGRLMKRGQDGVALTKQGALTEGETALREALAVGEEALPAFRYELALNLLAQGRYREAWPLYRARRDLPSLNIAYPRHIRGPRWAGEDLNGKRLLVLAEQGQGDTLQLARFLPQLIARGAAISMVERPSLVRLLQDAFPAIRVGDPARLSDLGPQDYWATTFDLLEPLDVALEALPAGDYLSAMRAPEAGERFSVGLCTSGNPTHANDRNRSLPTRMAHRLQKALPGEPVDLRPESTGAKDFADTARLMAGLDLVVSVDTAVAHLAGALGKPCLLLVPDFATDWRWLRNRDDSPWYPGHRLYRSAADGDWSAAIDRVVAEARRRHDARD